MSKKDNETDEQTLRPDQEITLDNLLAEHIKLSTKPLRELDKPWSEHSEAEQQQLIDNHEIEARLVITRMMLLMLASKHHVVKSTLSDVTFKADFIKGTVKADINDPLRHELSDFSGRQVMLVLADPEDYLKVEGIIEAEPDQPGLDNMETEDEDEDGNPFKGTALE